MGELRLTYTELGLRLGRTPEAARRLAGRKGWRRVTDNAGRTVLLLDEAELGAIGPGGRPDGLDGRADGRAAHQDSPGAAPDSSSEILADALARATAAEHQAHALEVELAGIKATLAAQEGIIMTLQQALAWHRQPWWRRWWR